MLRGGGRDTGALRRRGVGAGRARGGTGHHRRLRPSLGAFLPKVIKQRRLDQANGLDIDFQERTPDAYAVQFNSGEFELGGSAALLTVDLADIRGLKVSYLFNLLRLLGAVVTQRPGIDSLADLGGKQLAAARGTPTTRCSNGSRARRSSIPPRCR
jgi:hypothetical protein